MFGQQLLRTVNSQYIPRKYAMNGTDPISYRKILNLLWIGGNLIQARVPMVESQRHHYVFAWFQHFATTNKTSHLPLTMLHQVTDRGALSRFEQHNAQIQLRSLGFF